MAAKTAAKPRRQKGETVPDEIHAYYDKHIEQLLRGIARIPARKAATLAMLCYSGWATVNVHRYAAFERDHKALDPWEADLVKAIGDLLLTRNCNREAYTHEKIKAIFGDE